MRYDIGEWTTNVIIAKTTDQFIVYINGQLRIFETLVVRRITQFIKYYCNCVTNITMVTVLHHL